MEQQSSNIGFIIWGVRNGFEIILASNPTEIDVFKGDVVTDNMRQICNVAPTRFFSIHRNDRFGAVTIYHSDTRDMVGRKAYIAITLYLSNGYRITGNVRAALHSLMDFYLATQGSSSVNMFTSEMIRERYSSLKATAFDERISFGAKKGYFVYQQEEDIDERLSLLNIDGCRVVHFLPQGNQATEQQLVGFESLKDFSKTYRVSLEAYDPQLYTVQFNNQLLSANAGTLKIDGLPGDRIIISEKSTGRQKRFEVVPFDQSHFIGDFFPVYRDSGYERKSNRKSSNIKEIIGISSIFLCIVIAVFMFSDEIEMPSFSGQEDETTQQPIATDPVLNPTSTDTILLVKTAFKVDTLSKAIIDKINKNTFNIKGIDQIELSENMDTVHIYVGRMYADSIRSLTRKFIVAVNKDMTVKPPVTKASKEKSTPIPQQIKKVTPLDDIKK